MELKGAFVALITPFNDDMSVDYANLEKLIEFQIGNGISGIVVCGTTGETATLSDDEYEKVISFVNDKVNKRCIVIAGAGANNTIKAVELTKKCKKIGVDYVLSTCPYYNKPSQRGIIEHYKKVASVGMPVILYNVPSRTGVNMLPETIEKLSNVDNIVALKEASGNVDQMMEISNLCMDKIALLSGDDILALPARTIGYNGVISVVANIYPKQISDLYKKSIDEAKKEHDFLYKINKNLFIEGNPVTVKECMDILKLAKNNVRLPLVKASKETRTILENIIMKGKI